MSESFSSVQDYQRCPKKYYWRHVERIQLERRNVNFFWGSEAHGFFQEFAFSIQEGCNYAQAFDRIHDLAAERCKDVEESPVLFTDEQASAIDMIGEALAMVERYLRKYWDESWEVLHVEEQFTYHIDDDHVVTFTPDLIVRDRNGNVWIIDWKTTKGSVPEVADIPFEDLQALIYAAGVKGMYPELKGFIFIRLRKKTPTQPRLNKTKDKASGLYFINNLKSIDTTYDVLLKFIRETAPALEKHAAHALRLAELRENDRFHWRETVIVTDPMIEHATADVATTLDHISKALETGEFYRVFSPSNWDGCKSCEFQRLCRSELLGWATEDIKIEEYVERDTSYKDYETEEPF